MAKEYFDYLYKKYSDNEELVTYIANKSIWDTDECDDLFVSNASSIIEHLTESIIELEFGIVGHTPQEYADVEKCADAIYDAVIEVEKEEYAEQALLSTDPYKYYGLKRSDF